MQRGMQIYFPPFTALVKKLVIISGVCFLLQYLAPMILNFPFVYVFALIPQLFIKKFFIWQPLTYMFLHGGILHLIVNMLMLWMFGSEIEKYWGSRRFLAFYLMAGIFSGFVSAVCYMNIGNPIVGASGAIYALLIAYGFMFPERRLLFFGIFPMKTKYFVMLICLMTFWVALAEQGGQVAHFAHIGGIIFGLGYMKFGQWKNVITRYKHIRKQAHRDRLKSRFRVISNDMAEKEVENEIDNLWDGDRDDPSSWN